MKQSSPSTKNHSNLSPLEFDVFSLLKPCNPVTVRDIHFSLRKKQHVALSSIAVILERLHQKRLVDRKPQTCRGGTRYLYTPTTNPDQVQKRIIDSAINALILRFGSFAVTHFEERFSRRKRQ